MNGKELLLATYNHEETERSPWVPYAGVHAGRLKGYTATEVLTDADRLYESLLEVHRLYVPDGMPVVFDLQLEAEALGCELLWSDDNPPSVTGFPLQDTDEIPDKLIGPEDGRISLVMDVAGRMKKAVGDETALFGLFTGPLTLASHLRGTGLFQNFKKMPEYVKELMEYCYRIGVVMIDLYAEQGMDIIAPVDPLVSQVSPKHFDAYLTDVYTRLFDHIRSKNMKSAFFVCGNALRNMELMCKTNPDGISIDENIPMDKAKAITDPYNITIGGNIPLTTTMLFGSQMDNMKWVVDMIDSLDSTKNLVVAPGCDMIYAIPFENAIGVAEVVRNLDKYRELLKDYDASDLGVDVTLPDYPNLERPLVEAFTLDSASCAACTYMWASALDMKEEYGDKIDVVEYKYTTREGIAQTKAMEVANLPSLYINGELIWASIIPSREEFVAELEKRLG